MLYAAEARSAAQHDCQRYLSQTLPLLIHLLFLGLKHRIFFRFQVLCICSFSAVIPETLSLALLIFLILARTAKADTHLLLPGTVVHCKMASTSNCPFRFELSLLISPPKDFLQIERD